MSVQTEKLQPGAMEAPGGQPSRRRLSLGRFVKRPEAGALAGAIGVYLFFVVTAAGSGFTSLDGTATWLNVAAELGILAMPVGLLMIGGEFDLSVGSVNAAASMIFGIAITKYGVPIGLSVLLALLAGTAIGALNGIVVVRTGLPSFIVTLATYLAVAGAALGISRILIGSTQVSIAASGTWNDVFAHEFGQFKAVIFWWLALALIATWVLTQTRVGNWILATGGDVVTARASGVSTGLVKIGLFAATGFGAALLGVIQAFEYDSGDVARGQNYVFNSIIAAVIGGVLLTGGYGSAIGVCFGVMTYGIVSVGVFYTGWNTDWVQLFLGVLLLGAVLVNNAFRRLAMRSGR